jgi:hypothetical protein
MYNGCQKIKLETGSGFPSTNMDEAADKSIPKKITNAQTVCNERNAKGKLCNGFLKQIGTGGQPAAVHLRGDDVLHKCQVCGTLYIGPPLGHVRDPKKMNRFVEQELMEILEAAGGTLPAFERNERGALVQVLPPLTEHVPAAKTPTAATDEGTRKEAEAQAKTGSPSAAPLSPAAATASPEAKD